MNLKIIFLAALLASAFGLGFYVTGDSGPDGILARYGAVLSKTFGDVFGFGAGGSPAFEIPLHGEGEEGLGASPQPASSGSGKTEPGIFPRNLSAQQSLSRTVRPGSPQAAVPASTTKTPLTPTTASAPISPQLPLQPGKININTAANEELQKITGVGPVIAQRIIDYRNQNGEFLAIEEIKMVNGIGDATFEKMKDEITVGDVAATPTITTATTTPDVRYSVSVSIWGDGAGRVVSNPAGINCGFDCAEDFPAGTKVVLTATPEANSSFGGWLEACTGNGDCILNVSSSRLAAVATFKLIASAQSAPLPAETPPAGGKILISEIFYDAIGSDTGKEFAELYNTGSSDADLSSWSLKRDGTSLASVGSKPEDKKIIKAGGFFLIGLNGYTGTPAADIVRSASLPNTSAIIELYDPSGNLIDSASYNNSVSDGQSYERQPLTESGQFAIQPNPSPQNSVQQP